MNEPKTVEPVTKTSRTNGCERSDNHLNSGLTSHVLPTSATMVGVCMTVIGLVKIFEGATRPSRIDEALAVNSVLFMLSALFSYLSIRTRKNTAGLESLADTLFMIGLGMMTVVGILFAFEFI